MDEFIVSIKKMKFFPIVYSQLKCDNLRQQIKKIHEQSWVVDQPRKADALLVIWGDGWMLKTIKNFYQHQKPFFGINCGSLGFLLNNIKSLDILDKLSLEELDRVEERFLQAKITTPKWVFDCDAVNDIIVGGNVFDFGTFFVKGEKEQISFDGTWLVISTPIGSTAYWLNLWWPVMPLKADIQGIAGIASNPFEFKIIDPQKLEISWDTKYSFGVGVDWRQCRFEQVQQMEVLPSSQKFSLLFLKSQNFEVKRLKYASSKILKC